MPKITERTLAELSQIQVRYFLVSSRAKPYLNILVIRYCGNYPLGSAGNSDARYMYAMASAGVAAFEPFGVIHDLSELAYEWGDMLEMVFSADSFYDEIAAMAVVVGSHCEEAVRTLLLGERSTEPLESIGYVFRDISDAWSFVSDRIEAA